ncbi:hypothetical protein EVG20_g11275, partial [Dentipellis fragilis]
MFPERSQELFPIACRVVSTDQWLVTRFDASWKVSEVKQYILSKVGGGRDATHFRYPPRHRPVSPITFASVHPPRNSLDTAEDSYYDYFDDYDFESDTELFSFDGSKDTKLKQPPTPQESQLPSPFTAYSVQQYSLLTFSTGLLLEDDYSLSWYQLRPHELLELHPPGLVVRLPREIMLEYIQPYFEAKVKALRIVWSDKDFRLDKLDKDRDGDPKSWSGKAKMDSSKPWRGMEASVSPAPDKSALPVIRRRRKTKLEWKERWVVINQGMFNLFKDRTVSPPLRTSCITLDIPSHYPQDPNPVHSSPLSSLCSLRGAEDLFHGTSGPNPSPHVICTKFRTNSMPAAGGEPQQDVSTSPISEGWVDPWSGGTIPKEAEDNVAPSSITSSGLWTRRGSKEDGGRFRKSSSGNVGKEGKKGKENEGAEDKSRREASGDSVKPDSGKKEQEGIWLILDMQDESYHDSLLRILHRSSSESTTSTFVPSPTVDEAQKPPTPPASPTIRALTRKPHALPYPDWRVDVARKAQKAGMGDVGLAMGYIMWEPAPEDKPPLAQTSMFATDEDSDESFDSEMEWERWEDEVKRHGRSRAKGKAKDKGKANQPISPMSPTQADVPGEI